MRLTRVYLPGPLATGAMLWLPEAAAGHVARVLRLGAGDPLRVFDGHGAEFDAVITALERARVQVRVGDAVASLAESGLEITLVQGVARGEKMDLILQKATELGVAAIVPVLAARSTVRLDAQGIARRHAHWHAVLVAASEQCGRARLPALAQAAPLGAVLEADAAAADSPLRLLLAPDAGSPSLPPLLRDHAAAPSGVRLLIGPEGGFAPEEIGQALAAGYQRCRLGPRVLRTETAGLAAVAALQVLAGDWRY